MLKAMKMMIKYLVAPARERGLKLICIVIIVTLLLVAPARERGLKLLRTFAEGVGTVCRSRKGAWIEIRLY